LKREGSSPALPPNSVCSGEPSGDITVLSEGDQAGRAESSGAGREREARMMGDGRTGDGVDELAVDEELGEPDLHLGHLEPLAAAPIRSRHGAAPRRAGVRRGMCAV